MMPYRHKPLPPPDMEEKVAKFGLLIPGRPASPSDGRAQHFRRTGLPSQQHVRAFANGSTIAFGSLDIVGEFKPGEAFYDQVLLIQCARMDLLAAGAIMVGEQRDSEDVAANTTSGVLCSQDYLRAGPLGRRPHYCPSIHDNSITKGMNTWFGECHPGLSSDSRFGQMVKGREQPHRGVGGGYGCGGPVGGGVVGQGTRYPIPPPPKNQGAGKIPYQDYYRSQHEPYLRGSSGRRFNQGVGGNGHVGGYVGGHVGGHIGHNHVVGHVGNNHIVGPNHVGNNHIGNNDRGFGDSFVSGDARNHLPTGSRFSEMGNMVNANRYRYQDRRDGNPDFNHGRRY